MEEERTCYYQALIGVLPLCEHKCDRCRFYMNESVLNRFKDDGDKSEEAKERGNEE